VNGTYIDIDDHADAEVEEYTALTEDEQRQAETDYFELLDEVAASEAASTEQEES
jgi:hypothetical protein